MKKTDEIVQQLTEITGEIERAQLDLHAGKVADISHMDAKIAQICEDTMNLPPAEAVKIQPIMAEMIGKLEAFGLALKDFKNSFKQQ